MLVLRGKLNGQKQAIVEIGIQPFLPTASSLAGIDSPISIQITSYRALLDTGASKSLLSHKLISAEGLQSHGKRPVRGVTGDGVHRLYWANIGFWANGVLSDPSDDRRSYFAWDQPIEVMNIVDNENFDALIGMDILMHFDFLFVKGGQFEIQLG